MFIMLLEMVKMVSVNSFAGHFYDTKDSITYNTKLC